MEYYQTNQYIAQKSYPYIDKILKFEEYKQVTNCHDYYLICLPQDECICLQELIESTKSDYVKIYIGQVIMIANRILQNLIQLFNQQKITHGNLCSKNIYIRLNGQKFNIIPIRVEIVKIHFVNYESLNQIQFQLNRKKDLSDVKNAIISWISQYNSIKYIKDLVENLNKTNSLDDIKKLLEQFNNQYVDINAQKLRNYELILDDDKRMSCLNQIQEFYQHFYKQQDTHLEYWLNQRYNFTQDNSFQTEMKKIFQLILTQNQKNIFGLFQIESIGILNEFSQDYKLNDLIQQIKKNELQYHQQLNQQQMKQLSIVGNRIDQLAQRQVSFQNQIQEKLNTEIKILKKDKIASAYKMLLAYELSQSNCNEMQEFEKIQEIIQICLEQQIDQYLEFQLKKEILKLMIYLK